MAYKEFTAGQEALAADINTLYMQQVVARFPTAAARTAAIASPVLNQLSMLDSRPAVVQYWTGSAWSDSVPYTQAGQANATSTSGQSGIISFPVTFGTLTAVVASVINAGVILSVDYPPTLTGFTCKAYTAGGATYTGSLSVYWIAWGTKG